MNKKLNPAQGGCWFCNREILDEDPCYFTTEFDAYLHVDCLDKQISILLHNETHNKKEEVWKDTELEFIAKEIYGDNFRETYREKHESK